MKTANQFMQAVPIRVPDDRFTAQVPQAAQPPPDDVVPINDALQIKAAEYWLKLGEADQALRELESLPQRTWNNPAAVKVRVVSRRFGGSETDGFYLTIDLSRLVR